MLQLLSLEVVFFEFFMLGYYFVLNAEMMKSSQCFLVLISEEYLSTCFLTPTHSNLFFHILFSVGLWSES